MSDINGDDGLFEYDVSIVQYGNVQGVKITSDCNEIQIWNQCAKKPITINNSLLIYPSFFQVNESYINSPPFIVRGNFGEMDRSQYLIKFAKSEISDGTANIVVVRKTYKQPEKIKKFFEQMALNGK